MKFELFIASRYLRAKRRQAVIGIITGISMAGVAAGVASLIVALAINNGFRQDLQQRLLGSSSHINLLRTASDGIKNWSSFYLVWKKSLTWLRARLRSTNRYWFRGELALVALC